jgi:hypothetical protein
MSSEEGGEHVRRMLHIVAVIVRHIADWQGGNASPIHAVKRKLLMLIH